MRKSLPFNVLPARKDFLAVKAGKRLHTSLFSLEFLDRNDDNALARVGFTVTKKAGNAVERNRIRRRLRALIRLHLVEFLHPGYDYVIIGRRNILNIPFETLKKELLHRITSRYANTR